MAYLPNRLMPAHDQGLSFFSSCYPVPISLAVTPILLIVISFPPPFVRPTVFPFQPTLVWLRVPVPLLMGDDLIGGCGWLLLSKAVWFLLRNQRLPLRQTL